MQYGFDLLREFITKQQGPTTTERQRGIIGIARDALRLPSGIQHIEKMPVDPRIVLVAHRAIAPQRERVAVMRQQHVPASVRAGRAGFEQHRIARRIHAMQVQQVERLRQCVNVQGRLLSGGLL